MKISALQQIADNIEEAIKIIRDCCENEEAIEFAQAALGGISDVEADFDILKTDLDEKNSEIDELEGALEEYEQNNSGFYSEIITPNGSIDYREPAHIVHREIMETLGEKLNKVGHNEIQRILDAV